MGADAGAKGPKPKKQAKTKEAGDDDESPLETAEVSFKFSLLLLIVVDVLLMNRNVHVSNMDTQNHALHVARQSKGAYIRKIQH